MNARKGIAQGMTVFSRDGQKLGRVAGVDDSGLFVEKGLFFPKEYGVRFEDVEEVRGQEVHLRLDKQAVLSGSGATAAGTSGDHHASV